MTVWRRFPTMTAMSTRKPTDESADYFEDGAIAGRHFLEGTPDYPEVIQLEITSVCNLRCVMCPIQTEQRKRSRDEMVIGMDLLKDMRDVFCHAYEVELTGFGEMFCHPQILEALRFFRECGLNVRATSNGMLLDEFKARAIVAEGLVDVLAFSLDAASKEKHDAIRPGGNFDTIMQNIMRLKEIKEETAAHKPVVHFNFLAMGSNIGELEDFVRLASDHGVKQVIVQGLTETEETRGYAARGENLREVYERAAGVADELGVALEFWYMGEEAEDLSGPAVRKVQVTAPRVGPSIIDCPYPWDRIFLKSNLDVQICATLWEEMVMGNLGERSIKEIWNGKAYREARDRMRGTNPPRECLKCTSKARRAPHRILDLVEELDLGMLNSDQLGLGFYPREAGEDGRAYRWAKQRSTVFLPNRVRPFVDVEMYVHPDAPELDGSLWINGAAAGFFKSKGIWQSPLRFIVPPVDGRVLQLDLRFGRQTTMGEIDPEAADRLEVHRPLTAMVHRIRSAGDRNDIGDRIDFNRDIGGVLDHGWYPVETQFDHKGRWSGWSGRFALRNSGAGHLLIELFTLAQVKDQRASICLMDDVLDDFAIEKPGPVRRTVALPKLDIPYLVFELRTEPVWNPPLPDTRQLGLFMTRARLGKPRLMSFLRGK